jgi:hypothetical protein
MTNCNEDIINAPDQCDPRQQITHEMIFVGAEFTERGE